MKLIKSQTKSAENAMWNNNINGESKFRKNKEQRMQESITGSIITTNLVVTRSLTAEAAVVSTIPSVKKHQEVKYINL